MRESQLRFIRQQGVITPNPDRNLYEALMLQPRIIGCLTVVGVLSQNPWVFLSLSAVLWWATLVPRQNLFDAIHNHLVALPRGLLRLGVAAAPRRFAQAMAALIALVIGAALLEEATVVAWIAEGLFAAGVMGAVFRDFCGAAQIYITFQPLFASTRLREHPDVGPAQTRGAHRSTF
jgi:Domain of unknown function (DUF4395)